MQTQQLLEEAGVTIATGGDRLEPAKVFYNPAMQLNRDCSVLAAAAFAERAVAHEGRAPLQILDALSASGLRSEHRQRCGSPLWRAVCPKNWCV